MRYQKFAVIFLTFLLCSCAASTGTRYAKKENSSDKNVNTVKKVIKEEFDITPYKVTIDIDDTTSPSDNYENEQIWYNYSSKDNTIKNNSLDRLK